MANYTKEWSAKDATCTIKDGDTVKGILTITGLAANASPTININSSTGAVSVTLTSDHLNNADVTASYLSDDGTEFRPTWTFTLDAGVKTAAEVDSGTAVSVATDGTITGKLNLYYTGNNSAEITYHAEQTGATLGTITGANISAALTGSGTTITLAQDNLTAGTGVSISGTYASSLTLKLVDDSTTNLPDYETTASWVATSGVTNSYDYRKAKLGGWTLNTSTNTISYSDTVQSSGHKVYATITGVKETPSAPVSNKVSLTAAQLANGANADGNATLTNKEVDGETTTQYALEMSDVATAVALDTTVAVTYADGKIKGKLKAFYSVSGDNLTYTAAKENQDVATLTGLASGKSPTISDNTKITIPEDALSKETITLSGDYASSLTLKLKDDSTTEVADYAAAAWVQDSTTTTTYKYQQAELGGYTFTSGSKTIQYNGTEVQSNPKPKILATLTNMQAAPSAPSEQGVITLTAAQIGTDANNTVTVENGKDAPSGTTYTLALDASLTQRSAELDGDPTATIESSASTATIKGTIKAYYTEDATNHKSIEYKKEQADVILGTINVESKGSGTISFATDTFTIPKDRLTQANMSITAADSDVKSTVEGYKLAIEDNAIADYAAAEWVVGDATTGKYKYQKKQLVGWTSNGSKTISYSGTDASSGTPHVLATITGLKEAPDNTPGENGTGAITLKNAQLNSKDVTLTEGKTAVGGNTDCSYTLTLDTSATENPVKTETTATTAKKWSVATAGTAVYANHKVDYYTLDSDANSETKDKKITYTDVKKTAEDTAIATISGLNTTVAAVTTKPVDTITGITNPTDSDKTFTLSEAAFPSGNNKKVTLDDAASTNGYKLSRGDLTAVDVNKDVAPTITVNNGTATIKGSTTKGYNYDDSETTPKSITQYVAQSGQTLGTITGLRNDLTATEAAAGITFDTTTKKVVSLSKDVLKLYGSTETATGTVEITDKSGYLNGNYLTFATDEVTEGKVVGTKDEFSWKLGTPTTTDNSAEYQKTVTTTTYTRTDDTTLTPGKTSAAAQTLVTLTGLDANATVKDSTTGNHLNELGNGSGDDFVKGVEVTDYTTDSTGKVTAAGTFQFLNDNVLAKTTSSINTSGSTQYFKFAALGDSVTKWAAPTADADKNRWEVAKGANSTKTATYLQIDKIAGYDRTNDSTIQYKNEVTTTLATITGLNTNTKVSDEAGSEGKVGTTDGGFKEGLKFSGTDILLGENVLPSNEGDTVKLSNDGNKGYKLKLATNTDFADNAPTAYDANNTSGTHTNPYWEITAVPEKTENGVTTPASNTATLKYDTVTGYDVIENGVKVTYKTTTPNTILTITGLSTTLSTQKYTGSDLSSKIQSITGIEVDGKNIKITDVSVLGAQDVTLVNADGESYQFAATTELTNAASSDTYANKVGDNYWTLTAVPADSTKGIPATVNATYQYDTKPGYALDTANNKKINYTPSSSKTLATVTGLKEGTTGTKTSSDSGKYSAITGIATTAHGDNTAGTFTLDKQVLTTTDVELTDGTGFSGKYTLAVDTTDGASKVEEPKVDDAANWYWTIDKVYAKKADGTDDTNQELSNTATYKYDLLEGYTLDTTTKKKITYTPETPTAIATVTGLKAGLTGTETVKGTAGKYSAITGINYEPPTAAVAATSTAAKAGSITLDSQALKTETYGTDTAYTINLTLGNPFDDKGSDAYKNSYELAVDTTGANNVRDKADDTGERWSASKVDDKSARVYLKQTTKSYYEVDATNKNKITYHPEAVKSTIATITGLSSNIVGNNLDDKNVRDTWFTVTPYVAHKDAVVGDNPDTEDVVETTFVKETEVAEKIGTIALKTDALNKTNKKNITITSTKYNLGLVSPTNDSPTETITGWSVSGTTATLKGTISAGGYALSSEGKTLTYTDANSNTTNLVKITGLKSGITTSADGMTLGYKNASDTVIQAVNVNTSSNDITINKAALGTDDIKRSNDLIGYTLKLDSSDSSIQKTSKERDVWRETTTSGTYEYKRVRLTYYTEKDGNIACSKEEDVKNGTNRIVYATVTGLKSGLTPDDDDTKGNLKDAGDLAVFAITKYVAPVADNPETTGDETVAEVLGKIEVLEPAALNATTATITAGTGYKYSFALNDACVATMDKSKAEWDINGTTATYAADFSDGYKLKADGKIYYVGAKKGRTIATITGLASGLTSTSGAHPTAGTDEAVTVNDTDKQFTLYAKGLTDTDVTLTMGTNVTEDYKLDYNLTLDTDVKEEDDATAAKGDRWILTSTLGQAKWAEVKPYYYTLDTETASTTKGKKVTYTPDTITKLGDVDKTKATITGLNSNIVLDPSATAYAAYDYQSLGLMVEPTDGGDPVFTPGITRSGSNFEVTVGQEAILGATVTLDTTGVANGYQLKYEGADAKNTATTEYELEYAEGSGTNSATATLKKGNSEYYKVATDGSSITHTAASTKQTAATITGLANELDVHAPTTGSDDNYWGLVKGTTDVLKFDGTNKFTVETADVFDYKNSLTLTDSATTDPYTLELKSDGSPTLESDIAPKADSRNIVFDKSTKTLTFTKCTTAGYTPATESGKADKEITYSPLADGDDIVKISGLNVPDKVILKTDKSGDTDSGKIGYNYTKKTTNQDGTTTSTNEFKELITIGESGNTVTFTEDGLNELAVSGSYIQIEGTSAYKFALPSSKTEIGGSQTEEWSGSKGTITYKLTTDNKFELAQGDTPQVIRYTPKNTVTSTISGLKETVAAKTDETTKATSVDGLSSTTTKPVTALAAVYKKKADGTDDTTAVLFPEREAVAGEIKISESLFDKKDVKVTGGNYKFTIDKLASDSKVVDSGSLTPSWTKASNATKATYDTTIPKDHYYATSDNQITYYKADKVTTAITLNGLGKAIKAEDLNKAANLTVTAPTTTTETVTDATTGTETKETVPVSGKVNILNAAILEGSSKVSIGTNEDYVFSYSDAVVKAPADQKPQWTADGKGTATYQYETTEGYKLTGTGKEEGKVITHYDDKWTPIITVSGIKKTVKYEAVSADKETTENKPQYTLPGFQISSDDDGKPILTVVDAENSVIDAATLKITNKTKAADWVTPGTAENPNWTYYLNNDYSLTSAQFTMDVDASLNPKTYGTADPRWVVSGTTLSLKAGTSAGYTTNAKKDSVVYQKENFNTSLATVSGIVKGLEVNDNLVCTVTTDASGNKTYTDTGITYESLEGNKYQINLPDVATVLGTSAVKIKEAGCTLSVINSTLAHDVDTGVWSIDKGKATLTRAVTTAGHEVSSDGKSIIYTAVTAADKPQTLATVNGLDKNLTLTTKVENGVHYAADKDGNVLKNNNANVAMSDYISLPDANNAITLTDKVLGTSKVSVTKGYKFALGSDVTTSAGSAVDYWSISGGKASYVNGKQAYYKLASDKSSVTYEKAEKPKKTYFTISGLSKTVTKDAFGTPDTTNQTVELNLSAFDTTEKGQSKTKVTIKGSNKTDNYTMSLDTTSTDATKKVTVATTSDTWNNPGKGKATLERNVAKSGYMLSSDGKTITYGVSAADANKTLKQTKATTLATLSGISASSASSNSSSIQNGKEQAKISAGVAYSPTIRLNSDDLDKKKVTLKVTSGDYEIRLESDTTAKVTSPKISLASDLNSDNADWSDPKKGKTTILGVVSGEGYTESDDYTINYTKAVTITEKTKAKAIATITGIRSSISSASDLDSSITSSSGRATMDANDLDSKVTVDGGGIVEFQFGSDYSGTSSTRSNVITGGAKDDTIIAAGNYVSISTAAGNDSINVSGVNVTVNAGKGNDHIDLGNATRTSEQGDVIIYGNGDGIDVIANFCENDSIKFADSKVSLSSIDWDNNSDVILNVTKGKIKLENYTGNTVNVNGKVQKKPTPSADLLLDNNYSMTAAANDLSEIIKADTGSYSPYQFSDSLKLTKEENFIPQIAYGSNKK